MMSIRFFSGALLLLKTPNVALLPNLPCDNHGERGHGLSVGGVHEGDILDHQDLRDILEDFRV
jgi:hypothetical protein